MTEASPAPPPPAVADLLSWLQCRPGVDGVQLWSIDDSGFHPRHVGGRALEERDRWQARACCLGETDDADSPTLALPLSLPSGTPAALLLTGGSALDDATRRACAMRLSAHAPDLDAWLEQLRVARLSGPTRQSQQLRSALAVAHSAEYSADLSASLAALRDALRGLVAVENFFVVLLDEAREWLSYPYFADACEQDWGPLRFTEARLRGLLSAHVIASGRVIRGRSDDLLAEAGHTDTIDIARFGPSAVDWLGVPVAVGDEVIGAIVVQSYDPAIHFADGDPPLLSMVADTLGAALLRRRARERLERTVAERTAELARARDDAERALGELRETQAQLLMAEKMASLGQLVAGVAHEVNTPLGVALTAASHLAGQATDLQGALRNGTLSRQGLAQFADTAHESASLIEHNLGRAARLIDSFKQVSVDRSTDERRRFLLDDYLRDLLASMAPIWRLRPISVQLDASGDLLMDSYPGTLGQIVSNLLQNCLLHAFAPAEEGRITVRAEPLPPGWLALEVIDDGVGMSADVQARAFDPFFTTKRNQGATGLGLHIVFNHVRQRLGGRVSVRSAPQQGSCVRLEVPLVAPH